MGAGKYFIIWSVIFGVLGWEANPALAQSVDSETGGEVVSASPDTQQTGFRNLLALDLAAGMIYNQWEPGLEGGVITFDTEGLQAWWAGAGLMVAGQPVFSLRYDAPFKSSPQQEEMLQAAVHSDTGFEQLVGLLDLLPITSKYLKNKKGFAGVLRALLSTRVIYTRNLYFGSATSSVDFAYFPMNAEVDREEGPGVAYGYVEFEAGELLNFKTEFSDFHIMVPVKEWADEKNRQKVVRLGYFQSRWEKPSESPFASLEGEPIIQDTRLDTEGFSGSYESGLFDPGFGWRLDGDWGILGSDWTSPIDNDDYLAENEGLNYAAFSLEGRLNIQLMGDATTLWMTLGARGQFRFWNIWRATYNSEGELVDNQPVGRIDKDRLYQIFAMIKIRI